MCNACSCKQPFLNIYFSPRRLLVLFHCIYTQKLYKSSCLSSSFLYRCTSFNGSLASSTPDNTAIPLAPVAITFAVFSTVTPPIAITGREVDWTTACSFFTPRGGTSFFESLGKIWPYIK